MLAERKVRKLVLRKTTLRLLSPQQLSAVAAADGGTTEGPVGQDSYRGCIVQDPTATQQC